MARLHQLRTRGDFEFAITQLLSIRIECYRADIEPEVYALGWRNLLDCCAKLHLRMVVDPSLDEPIDVKIEHGGTVVFTWVAVDAKLYVRLQTPTSITMSRGIDH